MVLSCYIEGFCFFWERSERKDLLDYGSIGVNMEILCFYYNGDVYQNREVVL